MLKLLAGHELHTVAPDALKEPARQAVMRKIPRPRSRRRGLVSSANRNHARHRLSMVGLTCARSAGRAVGARRACCASTMRVQHRSGQMPWINNRQSRDGDAGNQVGAATTYACRLFR